MKGERERASEWGRAAMNACMRERGGKKGASRDATIALTLSLSLPPDVRLHRRLRRN